MILLLTVIQQGMMNNKENEDKMFMELRKPKKKRHVRLRKGKPFPIDIDSKSGWTLYTGHLSAMGVCIAQPYEIKALNSMGFFGKGSLSRSFPNFESTKGNQCPTIRHRQWVRRLGWFQRLEKLNAVTFDEDTSVFGDDMSENHCENISNLDSDTDTETTLLLYKQRTEFPNDDLSVLEDTGGKEDVALPDSGKESNANGTKVDEVTLDSTEEEDDVCEITDTDLSKVETEQKPQDSDVILMNTEEASIGLKINDLCDSEDADTDDVAEMEDGEIIILPDSDSDTENYLTNVQPRIETNSFPIKETLHLTFEETFFLMFGLGCLELIDFDGTLMDITSAWNHFRETQRDFVQKYVVYHYFRSKGWVVKTGLKYGGDFLLYKDGPPFYHASYIVVVEVVDADTLVRDTKRTTRNMSWEKLFGLDRLSETAAKEILFAAVLWPSAFQNDESLTNPEILGEFSVKESLYRRWIPKKNRDEIDLEDETDVG